MSRTFSKLFASITESTIWVAPDPHLRLWVYFLANADQSGRVWGSIPGISSHARVPLADTEAAIKSFMSPDPYSRTKDNEGRRIEEIDGGWQLLNYRKYREMRDDDARAEQNRAAQERFRSKQSKQSKQSKPKVSRDKPQSAQAEAEAEAEAERSNTSLPSEERVCSPEKLNGKSKKHLLPFEFGISDRVRAWAATKGHDRLEAHLEHFIGYAKANAKTYADWDQALMNAIRDDWAKLRINAPPDYSSVIANLKD